MVRREVKSKLIKAIDYNPATRTLRVEFKHGTVHLYTDVPKKVHEALINARSIDTFLKRNIRSRYPYYRIA